MWSGLTVVVTAPGGAPTLMRAGHTSSIVKKQNGKWVTLFAFEFVEGKRGSAANLRPSRQR